MADEEMSRARLAEWLVSISRGIREAGDAPLVYMDTEGAGRISASLADEVLLVAMSVDYATAIALPRPPALGHASDAGEATAP